MEEMDEMESLKDRGERQDLRDQLEVGRKKGSKVPVGSQGLTGQEGEQSKWTIAAVLFLQDVHTLLAKNLLVSYECHCREQEIATSCSLLFSSGHL